MHLEISNNSMSIIQSCPKKYYWTYVAGLKPIKKSTALSLGGVLHEAFQWFYGGASHGDVLKFIESTMDIQISKATPEEHEDLVISKYTLMGLWKYWPWKFPNLDWQKIESEKEFRIPVPGMRGVTLVGKVDGLVTDLNGVQWVRELKTTSQPFSIFELRSRQSRQVTAYIYAMRKLGHQVAGVNFEFCKKPLLRKGVNETADSFGQRVMADPGNRPDQYFKRHPSYRSDEEIELFEQDMIRIARHIRQKSHSQQWERNMDQCYTYNTECPYLKICFQKTPDQQTIDSFYTQQPTSMKGA